MSTPPVAGPAQRIAGETFRQPVILAAGACARLRLLTLTAWLPAVAVFAWLSIIGFATRTNPDEAAYKIVDIGIVHGQWPYRDLFINRQPLTFLWYLPMGFGASINAQRVIAAAMMAASVPVVMRLAARWLSPYRALPAGIAYALLLSNPLMPVRANTEAFILLPLTASFAVGSPVLAGALFGVAVMTKLHAAVFAPVLFVLWRRRLLPVACGAIGVVAVTSLPFLLIWRDYWDANVTFAFAYGQYTSGDRLRALTTIDWFLVWATLPLWVAALVGAVRSRHGTLVLWAVCAVVSVKASGYDYDHYYALVVPPVALLAVEGMAYMHRRRPLRVVLVATSGIALLIFGMGVFAIFHVRGAGPYELLGDAVAKRPGEVYVLGSRSDIYTYADRSPERRFFFSIPYVIEQGWSDEVRADLSACPPEVLVVPADEHFAVPWRDDITALYATSRAYEAGVIYTEPSRSCARSAR